MIKDSIYDWIVVGGGVAGISVAEILCREGKSVLLLEKNDLLASETSKEFHEWMHSGALYSLVPDSLLTLRYLLGATDDLMDYYSAFTRMNILPTESGLSVSGDGWFNNENIEYRYRIRKINPFWMSLVSRSINIVNLINDNDWLRRRGGADYVKSNISFKDSFNYISDQLKSRNMFYNKISPDLTMNSRVLINDLVNSAVSNGLVIKTSSSVLDIQESDREIVIKTSDNSFNSHNAAVCSPDLLSKLFNIPIKVSYAPIVVVEGVPETENSFVELDYNIKKCINLLRKPNGIGQAGGITVNKKKDINGYLDYIVKEHQLRNPELKVIDSYVGLKKELVQKGENRNYLYHINQKSTHLWSIVLGKFSLAFSMAPEFYRRIYHKNPTKYVNNKVFQAEHNKISRTSWKEILDNKD